MSNHCDNCVKLQFKNKKSKDTFVKNLKLEITNDKGLCGLVGFNPDALETFSHSIVELSNTSVDVFCCTDWSPVNEITVDQLIAKYDLISVKHIYCEPGGGFAGTDDYTVSISGEVVKTESEDDYETESLEDMEFKDFVKILVKKGYDLPKVSMQSIFNSVKDDYGFIYITINKEASDLFADADAPQIDKVVGDFLVKQKNIIG